MENSEYELVVIPGRLPLWRTILAAFFFSCVLFSLYDLCECYWNDQLDQKQWSRFAYTLGLSLSSGITFSLMKTVLIDTDKDKLVSRYFIGPFQKEFVTSVPQLEYVAVFKNQKEIYEVNLWYKGNKHYKMYGFDEKKPAMDFAELVSKKLSLDILDATERGNSQWIDKVS